MKYKGEFRDRIKKAQDDEKAIHWIEESESSHAEEFFLSEMKADLLGKQVDLENNLEEADFYSRKWNYDRQLAEIGTRMLKRMGIPKGFEVVCTATKRDTPVKVFGKTLYDLKDGILLVLKYQKRFYYSAFWVVRQAEIDLGALQHLLLRLENTVDYLTGSLASQQEIQKQIKKSEFEKKTGLVLS